MFDIFDEQTLQTTIFAIFDKQTKQTISIFLVYRKLKIQLSYKLCSTYYRFLLIVTLIYRIFFKIY